MKGQCEYKGKIIKNIPYNSEPRWFVFEQNGEKTRDYPFGTLKEAKQCVDYITREVKGNEI